MEGKEQEAYQEMNFAVLVGSTDPLAKPRLRQDICFAEMPPGLGALPC